MSCTFWNMRRRLRKQLGVEREVTEEKVTTDIATAQKKARKTTEKKTVTKNDG